MSLIAGHQSFLNVVAARLTPGTRLPCIQPSSLSKAGPAFSPTQPTTFETTGRRVCPSRADRSVKVALRTWTLWARVSPSRPNLPWKSRVCSMMSESVAAWVASLDRAPPTFLKPSSAALASIADCLRLTPYRSIGSLSPLRAEEMAWTASVVEPPNPADRSAPREMRSRDLPASSSKLVPPFLSCVPMTVANS